MFTPILTCAATTSVALLLLEQRAASLGLIEKPGGHRTHVSPTPVVGGLGMALGLLLTWALWEAAHPGTWIAAGAAAMVALGAYDDRHGMAARYKFALQALITGTALILDGTLLVTLGELLPGHEVRVMAGAVIPFSVFCVLGVINGVNMLDGLDGLAGTVVLVAIGWFALFAWSTGDLARMIGTLSIVAVVAAFLLYNARLPGRLRARLFMGDAGSMLLGFLLGWIAIDMSQRPGGLPPVAALWICALPILDTLAVMVERARNGSHLMAAGRDHLHHVLRRLGLSVGTAATVESLIAVLVGGIGFAGWWYEVPDWMMMGMFVVFSFAYIHVFVGTSKALLARNDTAMSASPYSDLPL